MFDVEYNLKMIVNGTEQTFIKKEKIGFCPVVGMCFAFFPYLFKTREVVWDKNYFRVILINRAIIKANILEKLGWSIYK